MQLASCAVQDSTEPGHQAMAGERAERSVDVVVVGAGFGGMYALHRLRSLGFEVQVFEGGTGVGGTWYWNRYPGARCDVESLEYSYSFDDGLQQEWEWTERYAAQPEILAYAEHVADRFDLRRDIRFETRVEQAVFDEHAGLWTVAAGDGSLTRCRFLIMAVGCLSSTNVPDIEGLDRFDGLTLHTGNWPKDGVELHGKRVGVVGTGSSGVQAIPVIARECEHLTVFQRTPQYTVPARNGPLDPAEQLDVKARYREFREANERMSNAFAAKYPAGRRRVLEVGDEERRAEFERRWELGGTQFLGAFKDLVFSEEANRHAAQFVQEKIAELVDDPEVAAKLTPHHNIGCKRLVIDTDYYTTLKLPNVTLVDVSADPIEEIVPEGVRTTSGTHELDVLVFATGFDAITGSILKIDVVGRSGRSLSEAWAEGPLNYLGLAVPGFPNLFTVTGPGSPSVLANMIVAIEQHVEWISDCIVHLDENGRRTIEADLDAAHDWVGHVNEVAEGTIFPTCNSWYLGANVPGKPRVFMPLLGFPPYKERCERIAADGYTGFIVR